MLSLRFLLKHETGLGWFAVGNAGVVVDWACDLSTKRAWASVCGWKRRRGGGGLGLRSWRGGGLGLPISAWWWLGLADLADLGLGLPSLFLLSSGVRYIITSFSFPLFSSKSCEFGFVCDVSVRGLVVYGGLVAVWRFGL